MAVMSSLEIRDQVELAPCTTLELGGPARHFVRVEERESLLEAVGWAARHGVPLTVLGGGSNVVISDAGVDGLVVQLATRGIELRRAGDTVELIAEAGEDWDELVALSVDEQLAGLECLSGIPGKVGATPIQNVGAYGQEVSASLRAVEVLDRAHRSARWLAAGECDFGYRSSRFKREPDRFIVLAARFALVPGGAPTLHYAELSAALAAQGGAPSLRQVREAVRALRRGKSMLIEPGDDNRRSAGSFFLNPIVSAAEAAQVAEKALERGLIASTQELPRYPQPDGTLKLSAAWLIERAGTAKGERHGSVGVSSRHSLALVHHGGGSSRELLELARLLRRRVADRFGVRLTPEPVLLGFAPGEGF
jgi:UDP-N-acetylmuramate dehydrogenase